ncbi:MAG: glycosyltransferase family 39 protein [Candidatus Aenigmatarchaeota archaeon]
MKNRKKIKIFDANPKILLLLILIFACISRLYFFVGIGFNDDSYYLEYAEKIYKGERFVPPSTVEWGVRIAVYYPVVLFWKIFGISELSTSMYFILLSLASIIVTYFIGKELFNEEVGILGAFLLSILPLDIIYSTQVGPEIPLQFFSSSSILLFIKSEKSKSYIYAFLSGLMLGFSYLAKSVIVVIIPILVFFMFIEFLNRKKKNIILFIKRMDYKIYLILILGFLSIFILQVVHFYALTGEWFYGERVRSYFFTHDLNSNSDLWWYIKAIFNIGPFFNWIHIKPLFGFFYYFVVFSTIYLIYKRDKNSIFLAFWFLFIFAFFEFGLQFFCTKIMSYCLYARHPRFLSIFSIPSMLLLARFFTYENKKLWSIFSFLSILFLTITSLIFTYQSYIFLRNGMGYVREAVNFLIKLPEKIIYIPDGWTLSKFKFFSKYNDSFINRLKIYECNIIDCRNEYYDKGDFIKDAYIVTDVSPYTYINRISSYPNFMSNPPKKWILLKNITLKTIGIFSNYNPKIYYSP